MVVCCAFVGRSVCVAFVVSLLFCFGDPRHTRAGSLGSVWVPKFGRLSRRLHANGRGVVGDVFENFRQICLRQYGLDPAH